ncbi:short-chain dehydrogenase reductase family [Colletotrichum acutatum]
MPGRLEGKNIIITGATGGIGLESSSFMFREGASVLMTDLNQELLDKALKRRIRSRQAVNHPDSWGGLDVIFSNAGIMHPHDGDAHECSAEIWNKTFDINVKGVWYGSKHAMRSLRKHGMTKGSVINTASMVAIVGSATPQLAYTASKGAVMALTRELAIVHAREGEKSNVLMELPLQHDLPGALNYSNPMLQDFLGDDHAKRFRREVHFPTDRFGEAIEQAQAVVFLASEESSFVNAHGIVVDGELTKAYVTLEGPATEAPRNLGVWFFTLSTPDK